MAGLILLACAIRLGSFEASDLLIVWFDEAGEGDVLVSERVPDTAVSLQAGVELRLAPGMPAAPPAHASFIIVRGGEDEPISQGESALVPHEDGWRAAVQIPVQKLPAGAYDIVMTLVEDGRPVGLLSRRIQMTGF